MASVWQHSYVANVVILCKWCARPSESTMQAPVGPAYTDNSELWSSLRSQGWNADAIQPARLWTVIGFKKKKNQPKVETQQ